MKKYKLFIFFILLFGVKPFSLFANGGGQADTIYICEGESVQLQTTPNDESYLWTPNQHINNTTIFNPIVSPPQTTTYYVEVTPPSDFNFVQNGNFELGNTGFNSDYDFTPSGTFNQGFYGIFTNPQQFNSGFGGCNDHSTTGSGLMMVVDGATILNEDVWCQTIAVYPGRTYDFSSWITSVHPTEPSILQFSINGELLAAPLQITDGVCIWREFSAQWFADCETTATICITNQSTIAIGNDFALDDISFTFAEAVYTDTFTVVVLENSFSQIDTIACENGSFNFEGQEVPAGEQQDFYYTADNGCDSIISVNVGLIDTFYFETRVDTLCPGESIFYRGVEIFQDTSICDVYSTVLGCDSTFCFVVYFLSEATIAISKGMPDCSGEANGSLLAEPFAGLPPYQYLWSTGSTNPFIDNLRAGTYLLTITDAKNCVAEKVVLLGEPDALALDVVLTPPTCFGENNGSVDFFPTGGTPAYLMLWEGQALQTPFVDSLSAQSYSFEIQDQMGCRIDTTVTMTQPRAVSVSTSPDTTLLLGQSIQLNTQIQSDFPYTLAWTPNLDFDCMNCEDPTIFPRDSRTYEIVASDTFGCSASTLVRIEVLKNYELYIPNAFSPNDDGLNDLLEVYTGPDVAEIEAFMVFDRWGGTLFERNKCQPETPDCGWDGRSNDQFLAPGVYVYLVKVRFIDDVIRVFTGDVLLVR